MDDAQQQVVGTLGRLRRQMVARLVGESAAVACAAAALGAACAQAGWLLLEWSPPAAIALCLLPLAGGLALMTARGLRRALALDRMAGDWAAAAWIANSLAVALALAGGWHGAWPAWAWPAVFVPAAALAGAAAAWLNRPDFVQAAIRIDRLGGFHDRVATAAELIVKNAAAAFSPAQGCLLRQAATVLAGERASQLSFWTRTSRTPALLLLALLLCGSLLLPDLLGRGDELSGQLAGLDDSQRRELVQRLHQQAAAAKGDEQAALAKAVEVVEFKNQAELEEALRKLEAQGFRVRALLAEEVRQLAQADAKAGGHGAGGQAATAPTTQEGSPTYVHLQPEGVVRVRVWDPDYARLLSTRPAGQGGPDAAPQGPLVPFDQAWQAACRQAEQALDASEVPSEHRGLVRRFFDLPR